MAGGPRPCYETSATTSALPPSSTITPPCGSQVRADGGPASTAAFARISASRAVGASAVAWTMPVTAGRPVAGSSRWCAGAPSGSSQLGFPIPAGCDAGCGQLERVQHAAVEGTRHPELAGDAVRAACSQVTPTVDGKAGVVGEPIRQQVRAQALADSVTVKPDAERSCDPAVGVVELDLAPA
jgi:hypothetical protein